MSRLNPPPIVRLLGVFIGLVVFCLMMMVAIMGSAKDAKTKEAAPAGIVADDGHIGDTSFGALRDEQTGRRFMVVMSDQANQMVVVELLPFPPVVRNPPPAPKPAEAPPEKK